MTPVFWWRAQVVVVVTAGVVDVVAEAGYGCGLVIMLKWLWYEWWHCSGGGSEWFGIGIVSRLCRNGVLVDSGGGWFVAWRSAGNAHHEIRITMLPSGL